MGEIIHVLSNQKRRTVLESGTANGKDYSNNLGTIFFFHKMLFLKHKLVHGKNSHFLQCVSGIQLTVVAVSIGGVHYAVDQRFRSDWPFIHALKREKCEYQREKIAVKQK